MPSSTTFKINDTADKEVEVPCLVCVGSTYHKVLSSVDLTSENERYDGVLIRWYYSYQIIQCQGCKEVSFRIIKDDSENHGMISPDEVGYLGLYGEELYPTRNKNKSKIASNDLVHIPRKLRPIYLETLQSLNNESLILTGIGLRAIVETICKESEAKGKNPYEKIDNLVEMQVLTPAGSAILHKVRTLGNKSAHEVKPHKEKQLSVAMDVIEHLLRDIYILPQQIKSEFKD